MNNAIGVCNLHYSPNIGLLTAHRPFGSVSFLGRYAVMDFTLSNFSNSGINQVVILAKNYVYSINNHIQNGYAWINNTKTGWIRTVINERRINDATFNTDVSNLSANLPQLDLHNIQYIVVAPVHFLTSMDFRPIIDDHIASGRGVTMVYTTGDNSKGEFKNCTSIKLDKTKKLVRSTLQHNQAKSVDVSLDTFVFSKDTLFELMKTQQDISEMLSLADVVSYCINNGTLKVNAYKHTNRVFPIFSISDYVSVSMDLLNHASRSQLFLDDWPVYTITNNTPPSKYGSKASVKNSLIGNGSVINGKVENCIISRDVVIDEGAVVKNCIIFTRTHIGKDVKLENTICDKNVKIKQVTKLGGSPNEFLVIAKGANV